MGVLSQLQRLNPLAALRRRFRAWWHARMTPTDSMTLTQRNVYILPTRAGWMLAFTLLLLLVASINYQLNLGYLLTFLIAGAAVVGMHVCHGNLRGLSLHMLPLDPQFAGRHASVGVRLSQAGKKQRFAVGLGTLSAEDDTTEWSHCDVPPSGSATVHIGHQFAQRGRHALPLLTAETRFPLGTFRVWTVWRPATTALVYPSPEAQAPALPPGEPVASGAQATRVHTSGEYDGVRTYRRGDPMKLVVWKKAAKSDQLVSRDTLQHQRVELWLDHATCGATGLEARLSRLTAWVLAAEKAGLSYGLRLPRRNIEPGSGPAHEAACLEALATC